MAHSKGGGTAWGATQRQVVEPVSGYRGAIAAAPVTDLLKVSTDGPLGGPFALVTVYALQKIYPKFDYHRLLTPQATRCWQLEGGDGVGFALLLDIVGDLLQPDWKQDPYVQDFVAQWREAHRRTIARALRTSKYKSGSRNDGSGYPGDLFRLPKKSVAVRDLG